MSNRLVAWSGTIAIGALLLAACAGQRPVASTSPSTAPSPPASISPTPTMMPTPSPQLLCQLPIDRTAAGGRGAFLPIPVAALTSVGPAAISDDPASDVSLPDGSKPTALAYSWSTHKWLPVRHEWVSPNGDRYVYLDSKQDLYVVATANGSARRLSAEPGMTLVGVDAGFAYLATRDANTPAGITGLTAVALESGSSRTITSSGAWYVVGGGWAWATEGYGSLLAPLPIDTPPPGNVLKRLDLANGAVDTVLTRSDAAFRILGLDVNNRPLLEASQNSSGDRLWSVPQPGEVRQVGGGTMIMDAHADGNGVWFAEGMSSAVFLAPSGIGAQPRAPFGGGLIRFAGDCSR